MGKDTKQKLLESALDIFSREGYEKTNIKDIAEASGIVKSGLYRHFDSKEAIWDAMVEMVAKHYGGNFSSKSTHIPESLEELYRMSMGMYDFTTNDPVVIKTRILLTKEQFRNEKIKELANIYFFYQIENRFRNIFKEMMAKHLLKECDEEILAFSFAMPVSALIHHGDRIPELKEELREKCSNFVRHFIEEYGIKGDE
ncbi:MAG: TetR/AcrR family transcriptional regulator [Erysipelotrichaceae bacterium]|nr:TetR/AcrR family transcriptional regulator [Erysipelotrichaceae bacterium]